MKRLLFTLALLALTPAIFHADAPVRYRFTFPEPQHHWMQVEVSFTELGQSPLELRVSRSSPGRYAIHDFAKNVYDVHALGPDGAELAVTRPDSSGWTVAEHGNSVSVRYKVFGDRVDGTYLAVDTTHVHMNMPAAIMWARGFDDRPAVLTFTPPPQAQSGRAWTVATQLHPGSTPLEFSAPNLQYLIDSPVEFGPVTIRQFSVDRHTFRFAVHHTGTDDELGRFVKDVERIVREEGAIYGGEYPDYEPGHYTFLADYMPADDEDGMEHRNSTVMTSSTSIRGDRIRLLDTVAHEFFHGWNVERIRPRDIEPFNLDRENISGSLWLAEGFTQYYGPLVLQRAGIVNLDNTRQTLASVLDGVVNSPGRAVRTVEEMSRMAPFIDGGRPIDRTNWPNTVISYYPFGAAVALGLDLSLRERSNGRVTLDDFMRAMWKTHGRQGTTREGYVERPYSRSDAEQQLAETAGDRAFARDFFSRYIEGYELPDYASLLRNAGLVLRRREAGRAWWGDVQLDSRSEGARVSAEVLANSPAYVAGIDQGDTIRVMGGERISSAEDVAAVVARHKPGDRLDVAYVDRGGAARTTAITLVENPHLEIVAIEASGGSLTPAQRAFRERWLNSQAR